MPTTYLEAAYAILRGHNAPLHYENIAARALEQGLIKPTGRTPAATMGSRLYTDTKQEGSRFARAGRGLFELSQTRPGDITDQSAAINQATRTQLADLLQSMPAERFEALITELLLQMGFDETTVTVTPYTRDGGIDVVGVYRAAGLTEVNAAVQVKRWRNNVQAPTVTQVRGSLQVHQQGIIITTSDFSAGARKEAAAPSKTRIGLINGKELLDLLFKHRVGMIERTFSVTTLDEGWWGELLGKEPIAEAPIATLPAEPEPTAQAAHALDNPTGRKPAGFSLQGKSYPAHSWADLLVQVCTLLAAEYQEDFSARILPIRGKKRPYFAESPDLLFKSAKIGGSKLWVEVNQSAKDIVKLIHRILDACDWPAESFRIAYA